MTGLSFLFTGDFEHLTRIKAKGLIKSHGGLIKTTVSKKVSYLLLGKKDPGQVTLAKADALGITKLDEYEFLKLIRKKSGSKPRTVDFDKPSKPAVPPKDSKRRKSSENGKVLFHFSWALKF